ncbi:MAG: type II toxin-antitoxin system VapC family toxin [Solirubrobacterales bacterium]
MILDSSAAVSVIFRESNYGLLTRAIAGSSEVSIGAPTLFETEIVVARRHDRAARQLVAEFLENHGVSILSFDRRHWDLAADAFIRFGKGRHPARLNYGDCMTYATARVASEPLLFLGNDFSRTDLTPALAV